MRRVLLFVLLFILPVYSVLYINSCGNYITSSNQEIVIDATGDFVVDKDPCIVIESPTFTYISNFTVRPSPTLARVVGAIGNETFIFFNHTRDVNVYGFNFENLGKALYFYRYKNVNVSNSTFKNCDYGEYFYGPPFSEHNDRTSLHENLIFINSTLGVYGEYLYHLYARNLTFLNASDYGVHISQGRNRPICEFYNTTFMYNNVSFRSGGCNLWIVNSTFKFNNIGFLGSMYYNEPSYLNDSVFLYNNFSLGSGTSYASSINAMNCTFIGNSSHQNLLRISGAKFRNSFFTTETSGSFIRYYYPGGLVYNSTIIGNYSGVAVLTTGSNMNITNNTIRNFATGIYYEFSKFYAFGNRIYNTSTAIHVGGNTNHGLTDAWNDVRNNLIYNATVGIDIRYMGGGEYVNNTLYNVSRGIYIYDSRGRGSVFVNNTIYLCSGDGKFGLSIVDGGLHDVIGNQVIGPGNYGIYFSYWNNPQYVNRVEDNYVNGPNVGIYVSHPGNDSISNNILENVSTGLLIGSRGYDNITNNRILNSNLGFEIFNYYKNATNLSVYNSNICGHFGRPGYPSYNSSFNNVSCINASEGYSVQGNTVYNLFISGLYGHNISSYGFSAYQYGHDIHLDDVFFNTSGGIYLSGVENFTFHNLNLNVSDTSFTLNDVNNISVDSFQSSGSLLFNISDVSNVHLINGFSNSTVSLGDINLSENLTLWDLALSNFSRGLDTLSSSYLDFERLNLSSSNADYCMNITSVNNTDILSSNVSFCGVGAYLFGENVSLSNNTFLKSNRSLFIFDGSYSLVNNTFDRFVDYGVWIDDLIDGYFTSNTFVNSTGIALSGVLTNLDIFRNRFIYVNWSVYTLPGCYNVTVHENTHLLNSPHIYNISGVDVFHLYDEHLRGCAECVYLTHSKNGFVSLNFSDGIHGIISSNLSDANLTLDSNNMTVSFNGTNSVNLDIAGVFNNNTYCLIFDDVNDSKVHDVLVSYSSSGFNFTSMNNISISEVNFTNVTSGLLSSDANELHLTNLRFANVSRSFDLRSSSRIFANLLGFDVVDFGILMRSVSDSLFDIVVAQNSNVGINASSLTNISIQHANFTDVQLPISFTSVQNSLVNSLRLESVNRSIQLSNSDHNRILNVYLHNISSHVKLSESDYNFLSDFYFDATNYSLHVDPSDNNIIANSTFVVYGSPALIIDGSNNTVYHNYLESDVVGIRIVSGSQNLIYDNLFNSSDDLEELSSPNYLNTTYSLQSNIIGGSFIFGNYWTILNGFGFSTYCADYDSNWVCDDPNSPYNLSFDYAPLASRVVPFQPLHNSVVCSNDVSIQINVDDNGQPFNCSYYIYNLTIWSVNESYSKSLPANSQSSLVYLGNGVYEWYAECHINGTYWNTTQPFNFTVANVSITLNASPAWAISYGSEANISCNASDPNIPVYLYENGTQVASGVGSLVYSRAYPDPGDFGYECVSQGSCASVNNTMVVRGPVPIILAASPSWRVVPNTLVNVSCWSPVGANVCMYMDSVLIGCGTYVEFVNDSLEVGTYNFVCNSTGIGLYGPGEVSNELVVSPLLEGDDLKDFDVVYNHICPEDILRIYVREDSRFDDVPVEDARVYVRQGLNSIGVGYTDGDGFVYFDVNGIDGTVYITVSKKGFRRYDGTYLLVPCSEPEVQNVSNITVPSETPVQNETEEPPVKRPVVIDLSKYVGDVPSTIYVLASDKTEGSSLHPTYKQCCLFGVCLAIFGICWYWWVILLIGTYTMYNLLNWVSRHKRISEHRRSSRKSLTAKKHKKKKSRSRRKK